jgi:hypothetical protein
VILPAAAPPASSLDPAWIGAAGVLVGVLISGLFEYLRNRWAFKRERSWELLDAKRLRLERIFELLYDVQATFRISLANAMTMAATGSAPSPAVSAGKVPWDQLGVLVGLYHPEFANEVSVLRKAGGQLTLVCIANGSKKATDVSTAIDKMKLADDAFAVVLNTVQTHVVSEVSALLTTAEVRAR